MIAEATHSEINNVLAELYIAVADLGFNEGGFVRSGALARPRKILQTTPTSGQKTTPFYV